MSDLVVERERGSLFFINALSIIIPLVVVGLLSFPNKLDLGNWTKSLSRVIGGINTLTTVLLIAGLIFIKRSQLDLHRMAMTAAFILGSIFLVCYVLYHSTNPANKFSGEGFVRFLYLFILFTHIGLSVVVLPLVLRAMYFAVTGQIIRHKAIVRYAYPIWLYVSASGVIVYLMLYHLFPTE